MRSWFHKLDRARNVQAGRELLERELKRLGLQHSDLAIAAKKFHADSVDDLYIQVALGDTGPNQVSRALLEAERAASQRRRRRPCRGRPRVARIWANRSSRCRAGNLLVQLARCCQPPASRSSAT